MRDVQAPSRGIRIATAVLGSLLLVAGLAGGLPAAEAQGPPEDKGPPDGKGSGGEQKGSSYSRTESYTGGFDFLVLGCEDDTNAGGVCFELNGDEASAAIDIDDATELPVGGLYEVRDAAGEALASGFFCDTTTAEIPAHATDLLVFVNGPVFGPIDCLAEGGVGAGTTGEVTATFTLDRSRPDPMAFDTERDCLEPVPASAGVSGVTDEGQDVSLDTYVLLDGVSTQRGQDVMTRAADSYAPLDVSTSTTFESVSFEGDDADGLLAQAKEHFGGTRPDGSDVVYVLTSKDIQLDGESGVAGLADCIGGVRYPERAFAVGEDFESEDSEFGPFTFYLDASAKIAAHEIGHLMGAHHHYANCAEGVLTETPEEPSPCSLMFNAIDFASINFSTASGAVVRGHAVDFASP